MEGIIINLQEAREKLGSLNESLHEDLDTTKPPMSYANIQKVNFAREKMGDRPQKYPIINWKYAGKNLWKVPILYGIYKMASHAQESMAEQHGMAEEITSALIGALGSWAGQLYKMHFRSSLPKIAAYKGFADGQVNKKKLPAMQTIQVGEYELPALAGGDNFRDFVRNNFDIKGGMLIAKCNKMGGLVNHDFLLYSADKYTRGDYAGLIDASDGDSWFVKDYTFEMAQHGKIKSSVNMNGFNIRVYDHPSKMGTFFRNLVWDKFYDRVDEPFDALAAAGFGIVPPGAQQKVFKDAEYKAIAAGRRAVFRNHSRNYFTYDIPVSYVRQYAPEILQVFGVSALQQAA